MNHKNITKMYIIKSILRGLDTVIVCLSLSQSNLDHLYFQHTNGSSDVKGF